MILGEIIIKKKKNPRQWNEENTNIRLTDSM